MLYRRRIQTPYCNKSLFHRIQKSIVVGVSTMEMRVITTLSEAELIMMRVAIGTAREEVVRDMN